MCTYSANQLKQCQVTDKNGDKTPRKNRDDTHCSWIVKLIEKHVGQIEETSYTFTFPQKLLVYLRKVVLGDTVGELRVDSYEVSLTQLCMAVDVSLC